MARSDYRTLRLLNRWPRVLAEDLFRFNQIDGQGATVPQGGTPKNVYLQYERDYIARSLNDALMRARDFVGFNLAPEWVLGETVQVNHDLAWDAQTYTARFGYLTDFGQRAVTLIAPDVDIEYTDTDDDGIEDHAIITVSTTVDSSEIGVFFRTADGASAAASEYWEIDDLLINSDGSTVTIEGHKGLFAHPQNVWAKSYIGGNIEKKFVGDTTDPDSFVSQVDVYRVYNDETLGVQLHLNPRFAGADNIVNATAYLTNPEQGQFKLYIADGQTAPLYQPDSIKIWYRSGLPLVNGHMSANLEQPLVRYANTLMPQQPALTDRVLNMWVADRNVIEKYGVSEAGMKLLMALKPIRLGLKATVSDWYPDAPPQGQ